MPSGSILLTVCSYALMALAFSAFSLRLVKLGYAAAPRNAASMTMLAAVAASALWALVGLADVLSNDVAFVLLTPLADVLRYGCWYACLLTLATRSDSELNRSVPWLKVAAVTILLVATATRCLSALGVGLDEKSRWVLLSAMSLPVFAMVLVEQLYRNVQEDSRWNAKPLCLGLAGTFLFDLYLFSQAVLFGRVDQDAVGIRGLVHTLMAPLLFLAISRQRDWISNLRLSRKAAFHSATLLISGIYLVFISSIAYYVRFFGGEWGRALQICLIVAAVAVLIVLAVSGSVRAKLRVLLGKHFFRYRYDYRDEWLRFTHALSTQNSPQEMGQQVVRGLADMVESPGGGLWIRSGADRHFNNAAHWNMTPVPQTESPDSAFVQFLIQSGWVIDLEEYRNDPKRYEGIVLPDWLLATPQAWLIVPLRVAEELTGFVVLASPRTAVDVNWEVNDLLKTAGRQAATFLAQMQATEALLEVRKFDAFNRMSAFVVHDLKNIVTQLSLMMKNAKRLQSNPEFQQDMLMTVENSLDRMRQLMLQLREGSTPAGSSFGVDLSATVRRIADVAAGKGRLLELEAPERITSRGHEERLERVIGHIVQNAFDATEQAGRVWVKVDRNGSQARVEVGDTGHGMSKEFVRERLFKPFQTTKPAGMGIGAYESFQYVQELGGTIHVNSEPSEGTQVVLLLPLFEAQNESDLHMLKAS
jgi:putative PEP-CTERM system histidine kinase